MTVLGGRKVNATGRATGALRSNRRTKIQGQFAARTIEMLESPALRVLSLSARRVLDRLEIELAHHGGQDNGRLPVTYEHFREYGIDRDAIAPAIRECEALGFIEITEHGRAGNAEFRSPNLFRLTYRNTRIEAPTDEWRKIESIKAAEERRSAARQIPLRPARIQNLRAQKQNPSQGKTHVSVGKTPIELQELPIGETPTTDPIGETPTTSISRVGTGQL